MAFHVPELARDTTHPMLGTDSSYGNNGAFHLESPEPGWRLALICSDGTDDDPSLTPEMKAWEHVSVHAYRARQMDVVGLLGRAESTPKTRTPTWKEMVYVKRILWDVEDVVVQFHPRESEYVNCHPHVLHLWRPKHVEIPTPPPILVGPMAQEAAR
jgi:hypothetical protein